MISTITSETLPEYGNLFVECGTLQTSEATDVIFFLCKDDSSYDIGTKIKINGGQHI